MKLPNAVNAIIEENKLVTYLLNLNHRRGGSKAKLLGSLGYSPQAGNAWTTISVSNISLPMWSSSVLPSGANVSI
jgi:hypothetical protein